MSLYFLSLTNLYTFYEVELITIGLSLLIITNKRLL